MNRIPLLVIAAVVCAAFIPSRADAVQVLQNASGACKSALPVFDGNIRNRPTAVANEGASNAFISCSMEDRIGGVNRLPGIWLHNSGASAVSATCTLVTSTPVDSNVRFYTKTQTFNAGTGNYLLWDAADNGGANYASLINFSCNLPPGVEIRLVTRSFD